MLFLARELHCSNGDLLRNMVVSVMDGFVNNVYSFSGEVHSMVLVDELFLSPSDTINSLADIQKISHPEKGERLYAYELNRFGKPVRVE